MEGVVGEVEGVRSEKRGRALKREAGRERLAAENSSGLRGWGCWGFP